MIIDIHSHLAFHPIYPDKFLTEMLDGMNETEKNKIKRLFPLLLNDKNCNKFLRQMDDAGVDKAVLLIIDGELTLGDTPYNLEDIYDLHYKILKNHPDRFSVFAGIDPRRGEAGLNLLKKGLFDYGFKGLKLYPPMGFNVTDSSLRPFLEICNIHHLPVLVHSGSSLDILDTECANPFTIGQVAKEFQNIKFILAHAGYNLTPDLIKLVCSLDNLFLDISGYQSVYKNINEEMITKFTPVFSEPINKKILYGSDWPLFNLMTPLNSQIEQLKQLAERINNKANDSLDNILYKNALNVLSSRN